MYVRAMPYIVRAAAICSSSVALFRNVSAARS
jgi:hypothetical protein